MGYPIQLVTLRDRRVLVAGGGNVAATKLDALLHAGARIHLIAPELAPATHAYLPRIDRYDARVVDESDVMGAALVIAATSDQATNRRLAAAARAQRILVNAVDDPDACDFFAPAIVRRGSTTVAVSTDGASPLLAAQLRRMLEVLVPESLASVSEFFGELRRRGWRGLRFRGRLLSALTDTAVTKLVDGQAYDAALARLEEVLRRPEERFDPGVVAIVGAGPGSRALLTVRALDRIQRADVILHDALVPDEILDLALPGTRKIYVGRRCQGLGDEQQRRQRQGQEQGRRQSGDHSVSASSNLRVSSSTTTSLAMALMIREARANNRVVRLHGGDPFVFGRGGEELDALIAAGVPYEIVPGISSALAAPALAGVPLTQREIARGFSVRTGHSASGHVSVDASSEHPSSGRPSSGALACERETVVILMGLHTLEETMTTLRAEGWPAETPAAAIASASLPHQKTVTGTLETLHDRVREAGLESPVTLVIGKLAARASLTPRSGAGACDKADVAGKDEDEDALATGSNRIVSSAV